MSRYCMHGLLDEVLQIPTPVNQKFRQTVSVYPFEFQQARWQGGQGKDSRILFCM